MRAKKLNKACAYWRHWLVKEDRYSQQSPFVYSIYQGALEAAKNEKPLNKQEKIAILLAYFCQSTASKQILELGIGNHSIYKRLIQLPAVQVKQIPDLTLFQNSTYLKAVEEENQALDFLLFHPSFWCTPIQEFIASLLSTMNDSGILVVTEIYRDDATYAYWKKIIENPSISLSMDFYDFGLAFKSYSGQKQQLFLSY